MSTTKVTLVLFLVGCGGSPLGYTNPPYLPPTEAQPEAPATPDPVTPPHIPAVYVSLGSVPVRGNCSYNSDCAGWPGLQPLPDVTTDVLADSESALCMGPKYPGAGGTCVRVNYAQKSPDQVDAELTLPYPCGKPDFVKFHVGTETNGGQADVTKVEGHSYRFEIKCDTLDDGTLYDWAVRPNQATE